MDTETQALIQQMQDKIDSLQSTINQWRLNGADSLFTSHSFVFGSGVTRLTDNGIEFAALAGGSSYKRIFWRDTFGPAAPSASEDAVSMTVHGIGTAPTWQLDATYNASQSATLRAWSSSTASQAAMRVNDDGLGGTQDFTISADGSTDAYVSVPNGFQLTLSTTTADLTRTLYDGSLWYRSDTNKFRARINSATENLATESYVTKESASAAAIATNGTITTANVTSARVAPTGAVTGVILQSGTTGGQTCTVVNEAVAANTVTFAASGTSHVADGTSSVVAGLTARRFVWDSGTSLWYPCK